MSGTRTNMITGTEMLRYILVYTFSVDVIASSYLIENAKANKGATAFVIAILLSNRRGRFLWISSIDLGHSAKHWLRVGLHAGAECVYSRHGVQRRVHDRQGSVGHTHVPMVCSVGRDISCKPNVAK